MSERLSKRDHVSFLSKIKAPCSDEVTKKRRKQCREKVHHSVDERKRNEIKQWVKNAEMHKNLKRKYDGYGAYIESLNAKRPKLSHVDPSRELTYKHAQEQLRIQNSIKVSGGGIFETPFNAKEDNETANLDFTKGIVNPNNMTGYEILALLRALLDMFEWEREENQVEFHEHFIATALPKIFRKEWETEYDKILRLFKKQKHDAETIMICPRRWGKTVSVAMFCAAYILAVPDAEIAIFSTAKRTSGKMMMGVLKFMQELPLFEHCDILTKNAETIKLSLYGNVKTISCYPGTVAVCILFSKWGQLVASWVYSFILFPFPLVCKQCNAMQCNKVMCDSDVLL